MLLPRSSLLTLCFSISLYSYVVSFSRWWWFCKTNNPYLTSSSNLPTISSQFILGHTRSYFCTLRTLSVTFPRLICMFPCLSRQYINSHYSSPFYDIQRILRHHPNCLIFPYQLPLYIEINFDDIFSPYLIFLKIYFMKTLIYSFIYTFVLNVNNGMLVTCKCHLQMFYK